MTDDTFCTRLEHVQTRIAQAAITAGRDPKDIVLLAVSKTQGTERIQQALACGQTRFGENYVQEFLDKRQRLIDSPAQWHFIGPIQSNKTRVLAQATDWVHSLDRDKIARRLHEQRPADLPPLQVCIQVNISDETSKSGVRRTDLATLAAAITALPRLHLRGLMAIPAPTDNVDAQHRAFAAVRQAFDSLQAQGYPLDTLSMGMSDDLEAAIAEGATIVRIGTAIFGPRPSK